MDHAEEKVDVKSCETFAFKYITAAGVVPCGGRKTFPHTILILKVGSIKCVHLNCNLMKQLLSDTEASIHTPGIRSI